MTAIENKIGPSRPHGGCDKLAHVREFTNGRRLIFCNACDYLIWEDVE